MTELLNIPCWYVVFTLIFALFHAVRGAIGQTYLNPSMEKLPKSWQKVVVFYVHDFLLHFVCTVFGFICLLIAFRLAGGGLSQLTASASLLMVFLALVGLAGVTGQLAVLISLGKLPLPK
jgi:membrane-bound ClpP family serine protease